MHEQRTGVNIGEGFLVAASAICALFTGVAFFSHSGQSYRKIKLLSESKDTLFVNMVTDWQWKDSTYFDIREIVLPPLKSMRLIVPMGIAYNIFFRNEYNAPDDEKVEINTSSAGKVRLKPAVESAKVPVNN